MRKYMRGSFTVEATVVVPLVLFVVGVLCYLLFYYHDKNVLMSAAHETAVYGSYVEDVSEGKLKNHIQDCVKGKCLLFSDYTTDVTIQKEKINMTLTSSKGPMSLKVCAAAARTNPARYIRTIQKMKKIGEE